MTTLEQLEKFHSFALVQLENNDGRSSLAELFELWQINNPSQEEHHEIDKALQQSLEDIQSGNTKTKEIVMSEIRSKYKFN